MFNWTGSRRIRRISVPPWLNFMALIFTLLCSWWLLSEKRRIQWIDVNATFSSITFQSDMRNCKAAAWKRCQTQYLTTICNLKRHFYLYVLVCVCYHVQKYLIWMLWPKCWVFYEAYCSHSFFLFHSWPFYHSKSWKKYNIQFFVTKRSQKFNLIKFSDPQPRNCG